TVGASVQVQFQTLGGTAPFTWTTTGSPAPGLIFAGGVLSGVPTVSGLNQFSIQVSDANGATASAVVTQTVNPALAILNPGLGGPFSRNGSMDLLLVGSGGTLPYTWSIAVGQLPGGLILNPNTGRLKGGFNGIGTYPLTLRLSDAAGASVLRPYLLVVGNGPQFQGDGRLPEATAATPYRTDFQVASSLPIVEWQVGTGASSLPPGLALVDRELIGTPTQPGKYEFEMNVRDQNGSSAVQAFTLVVNPPFELLESASNGSIARGSTAQWAPQRKGGSAPFRFLVISGAPPVGMQMNASTGEISGTPQRVGDFGFTIEATDANGAISRRLYLLRVVESFLLRLESLGSMLSLGRPFTGTLEVQGGVPPYQVKLGEGELPPGLTLSSLSLTGTPTRPGSYPISFTATDASGLSLTRKWVLTVSSGVEVFPSSLDFSVVANSSTAVRQTIKFQSSPTGTPVQLESTAPWLKLSSITSQTPGFIEVWVEPLLLPPGISGAEIILRSGSEIRVPVSAERVDSPASGLSVELFPGPGGSWGVLMQAIAPRLPFSVSLDTIGVQQFNLSENKGDILAPESFLLWLDRRSNASNMQRESSLAIRNLATGEEQRMVVPSAPVDVIEASVSTIELSASLNAATSSSQSVNFRSTSPVTRAIAAVADQPWVVIENPTGSLSPNHVIRFSARPNGLNAGLNTALVEVYDSSGKIVLRLPVELWVGELVPPVELSEYSLIFSRKNLSRSLRLRNPSKNAVTYSARSSSAHLRIANPEGIIPADGEIKIELSAAESALGSWSRHSVLLSLNHTDLRIVEADFALNPTAGTCPSSAPVLSFLSPGAAFQSTAGESQTIRVAVRNPCGEILSGAALSVLIPDEAPVPLLPSKDGTWYGVWTPLFPNGSLNLEAIWLDPANRQSVTRWLSGAVQP
ncbi:MAG: Ig domain-containing protein, partial [Acidobacteria bacterium]|nr:Ig domain-containing protein [Acidobacteriota bacterium]